MRYLCFFLLIISSLSVNASFPRLSEDARITLLTCSPGNEVYSIFGHNALRVQDSRNGVMIDSVFNYGTFSFTESNFTLKFAQGKLNYSLSRESFGRFQQEYIYDGRGIEEQTLDLSGAQKQALYEALCINYLPENRDYKYDFFFDNCATRIRDMVKENTGRVVYKSLEGQRTFRELIQLYLGPAPWTDFGIDLALGMPCDAIATPEEEMFLPDFLHDVFNESELDDRALVLSDDLLLGEDDRPNELLSASPMQASIIYLVISLVLLVLGWFRPFWRKLILRFHLLIAGLLGVALLLLWFATDHTITANNLNLMWAWPMHLLVLASTFQKRWSRVYLWLFVVIQVMLLVFWNSWPQDFHEAFIPIIVAHLLSALVQLMRSRLS